MKRTLAIAAILYTFISGTPARGTAEDGSTTAPWSTTRINEWYAAQPWPVGCNFIPSTAINQLEMWQAGTFDLPTIDRELGMAHSLGFTSVRVFLHNLLWDQDSKGFLDRMDQFLAVADKHKIRVMFVLFDSVWDPYPKAGKQPDPRPRVMASAWVQAPGADILKDAAKHDALKPYVTGVVGRFKNDPRVHFWDVFNEPDNTPPQYHKVDIPNKAEAVLSLMKKVVPWIREINPSQPLTTGVWIGGWEDPAKLTDMQRFQFANSDIISFHSYDPLDAAKKSAEALKRYNRPILCTEYMARTLGSTFDPILGYFQEQRIGAYNWGLVLGKTQTSYPWDSWDKTYTTAPDTWFHDIFHNDGRPYSESEIEYIKSITGRKGNQ